MVRIAHLSRAKDWRASFIPFILGCVYLWLAWFGTVPAWSSFLLVTLSSVTSLGFASFGYLMNEYFDRDSDRLAGKLNRLSLLPITQVGALFLFSALLAILPWAWLPTNGASWTLIALEFGCFAVYSFPVPRLKNVPVISNLIDAAYAYVIPLVLSFHTYALFHATHWPMWLLPLVVFVSVFGLRGIIIHQVDDLFKDRLCGTRTLPDLIGPNGTSKLLVTLLVTETLSFSIFSFMLAIQVPMAWSLFAAHLLYCALRFPRMSSRRFLPIASPRHATDQFYQIGFPMLALVLLITVSPVWALLMPFHLILLVPAHIISRSVHVIRFGADRVYYVAIRGPVSAAVNHTIYYGFLLLGVNLKKRRQSAAQYLRSLGHRPER